MKKNVFSRTLAVLASTAVLGAASMISASAAQSLTISDAEGLAGETVTLEVVVECDNNFESLDIVTNFDEALTAAIAKPANGTSVASDAGAGYCTVVAYGSAAIADGAVATIDFTIPEDAEAGDTYTVEVTAVNTFAVFEGEDLAETVPVANGTITVGEAEPEPTDPPATTPAPTTTAEPTTTTEAPTTTTAAPTTGAPKTGNAGVAVAVAGLVAAGATAVVLKKRH